MRRPSVIEQRRSDLGAAMTPMIDVVFLLLVFFLWTASFQRVEQILPGALSIRAGEAPPDLEEPPPPEADFDDVVVRIQWTGDRPAWSINESSVATLSDLRKRLAQIAAIKPDAPVILDPQGRVPMGNVIDVYDISRLVGFQKVQFAASLGGSAAE